MSFIARVKPLSTAAEHVFKSEVRKFCFLCCSTSQRTFYTKKFSNSYQQKCVTLSVKTCYHSGNTTKNFGKVVELEDFNALEVEDEEIDMKKKKSRPKIKKEASEFAKAGEEEGVKKISDSTETKTRHRDKLEQNSALLSSLMTKLKTKKLKDKYNEFLLEGKRLINEAITAGLIPQKIFFSRASDIENLNLPAGTKTYRVPYKTCELWSDVKTPQGVIGVFKMPDVDTVKEKSDCLPLTIICDNVRDPGNLGSIIRTVASAGCKNLILTPGCTDVWEPKVIRSSAGAHFHFPILKNCVWTDIENLISDSSTVFIAEGYNKSENDSEETRNYSNFTKISEISQDFPLTCYYSVKFENKNTVFIIGGETHGVSDAAFEFAQKRNGTRLFIPMSNNIESLNNSVALAILAFEFKRQLNCNVHKESLQSAADNGGSGSDTS